MGGAVDTAIKQMNGVEQCDINLDAQQLRTKDIIKLSEKLKNNKTCFALHLSDNYFEEEGLKALAGAIQTNRHLKRLYLKNNNLEDIGCEIISEALARCAVLGMVI